MIYEILELIVSLKNKNDHFPGFLDSEIANSWTLLTTLFQIKSTDDTIRAFKEIDKYTKGSISQRSLIKKLAEIQSGL